MATASCTRMGTLLVLIGLSVLPASRALGQEAAAPADAEIRGEHAFPTGDRDTSILLIQHRGPAETRANVPFTYEVHIRNLTNARLPELVITEQLPEAFTVRSINPEPANVDDKTATWTLGRLEPGAVQVIRISGVSEAVGELSPCTTVAFRTSTCSTMKVVQPALTLTKSAPGEVILCDTIPVRLVVSNTGTGVARNVKVTDTLPQGWETTEGRNEVNFEVATLRPGESQEFSFQARSRETGNFVNEATASEPGGLTASASTETVVRRPVLTLAKEGPEMRYIGRAAEYKITVGNTGDAPARDTVLVDTVSGVGEFVRASNDGRFADGKVTWSLGTLEPGDSKTVEVSFVGRSAGNIRNEAVATAYCAEARASAGTEVRGIAALLLETIDVNDPIEVGSEEIYTVTVTNQGTADDHNIRIVCTLPPEMEFVSAEGPTRFTVEDKTVTFEPIPALAPKARAVFRVVTRGTAPADVRFRAVMTSDMLTSPVVNTESTHIY